MKNTLLLLVIIAVITSSYVEASIMFYHNCEERNCMGGTNMTFTVQILNNIAKRIIVDNVRIVDKIYNRTIVSDDTRVNLYPGQGRTFILHTEVPEPVEGYTIYYYTCFDADFYNGSDYLGRETVCSQAWKSLPTIPKSKIFCTKNEDCNSNEYCNTFSLYKCKKLECGNNMIAYNHTCINANCNIFEKVEDNTCVVDYQRVSFVGVILLVIIVGIAPVSYTHLTLPTKA